MKTNMGAIDKLLRILAATVIVVLYFAGVLNGATAIVLLALAGIFILSSFTGVCPLYSLFGIHTNKK
ncbi:YgaP family membrane protein [Sediminibacterium soli]|uniref:YgaP family membrane protein n=1 Tax=Sediminibacterium soli TaxID=2698829 RepID=UPI00137B2652|nr:DUF2892 domain-containing protein [Sediminibacterium soli]NCI45672.1 DUF2892 domain-containing protein [Sediminibacterium soli]